MRDNDENKFWNQRTRFWLGPGIPLLVALIGIAFAVLASFSHVEEETSKIRIFMDFQSLSTALNAYKTAVSHYPRSDQGLNALLENPGVEGWKRQITRKDFNDPWGRQYGYRCPGTHNNKYDLFSAGPDGQDGTEDDIGNWEME